MVAACSIRRAEAGKTPTPPGVRPPKVRSTIPLLATAVLCACSSGPRPPPPAAASEPPPPAGDPIARLTGDASFFFLSDHATGAEYTELRPDSTYRTISREHMFVGETDAGRWRQTNRGELLLCSEHQYRYISAPPLWVVVGRPDRYAALPELRTRIRTNLAHHSGSSFLTKSLEEMGIESEDFGSADTSRDALVSLAAAIDAYLASGDENLFRTWPRGYGARVYLNPSWTIPSDPADPKLLRAIHDDLDRGSAGLAVLRIDESTFSSSTASAQPFVFYPEMNDCVGKAVKPRDLKGLRVEPRCRSFG